MDRDWISDNVGIFVHRNLTGGGVFNEVPDLGDDRLGVFHLLSLFGQGSNIQLALCAQHGVELVGVGEELIVARHHLGSQEVGHREVVAGFLAHHRRGQRVGDSEVEGHLEASLDGRRGLAEVSQSVLKINNLFGSLFLLADGVSVGLSETISPDLLGLRKLSAFEPFEEERKLFCGKVLIDVDNDSSFDNFTSIEDGLVIFKLNPHLPEVVGRKMGCQNQL